MRMLALTRYGRQGASSRVRTHQYLPYLRSQGIEVDARPLFSDSYVAGLQQGLKRRSDVAQGFVQRIAVLLNSTQYDLIWIEKEGFPWLLPVLERWLLDKKTPWVLDYDDAVFHRYDMHRNAWVKNIMADKIPALMRRAALVVTGNQYLTDFAQKAGAKRTAEIPTVIDLDRYPASKQHWAAGQNSIQIGWIGQRSTAHFLNALVSVMNRLQGEGLACFTAIGADAKALDLPMNYVPWSEETEAFSIGAMDVGVMPLPDESFERGKCGYKLIQYMACGLPVVASPVGANKSIVEHGVNGLLAETEAQWEEAFRLLAANPDMRARMGQAGRAKVEKQYCLQVAAPRLAQLLLDVASAAQVPLST